jgi:hypothetical protein
MIAGRRARKRSLIRSKAMTAAMAGTLSSMDGVATFPMGSSYDLNHSVPAPQPELRMYLRQLSTLHAAGILTDEEFSAARTRLFGS